MRGLNQALAWVIGVVASVTIFSTGAFLLNRVKVRITNNEVLHSETPLSNQENEKHNVIKPEEKHDVKEVMIHTSSSDHHEETPKELDASKNNSNESHEQREKVEDTSKGNHETEKHKASSGNEHSSLYSDPTTTTISKLEINKKKTDGPKVGL